MDQSFAKARTLENQMADVFIYDATRTPRGRGKAGKGALSAIHPQELLATCLKALPDRVDFDPKQVEDVVAGCVSEVGEQAGPMGRQAARPFFST